MAESRLIAAEPAFFSFHPAKAETKSAVTTENVLVQVEALIKEGKHQEAVALLRPIRSDSLAAKALCHQLDCFAKKAHAGYAIGLMESFGMDLANLKAKVETGQSLPEAFESLSHEERAALHSQIGERRLQEIFSISQNQDPDSFWQEALSFGVRLKNDRALDKAAGVLGMLSQDFVPEKIRRAASRELDSVLGKGHGGLRVEVLVGNLAEEATSYKTIVPMVLGSIVAKGVGTTVLSRLAGSTQVRWFTRGLGVRALAGTAAYLAEVPVFALSARSLAGSHGSQVSEDLGRAALTLGALRLFGFLGNQAFRKMHGINELGVPVRLAGLTKFTQATLPQAAIFTGLYASHKLEEKFGLRAQVDGATTSTDILASMVSMGVGAHLGHKILGKKFAKFEKELEIRASSPSGFAVSTADLKLQPGLLPVQGPAVFSVRPTRPISAPMMMTAGRKGGGGSGRRGAGKTEEFKLGGKNSTELIRRMKELSGETVGLIEARMRAGQNSEFGFLGSKDSLRDTLARDNDFVLSRGLSHQEIADGIYAILAKVNSASAETFPIVFQGQRYMVQTSSYGRGLEPPLPGLGRSGIDFTIFNLDTNKTIHFWGNHPEMIKQYGFYGGPGSPYRLEPNDILDALPFLEARRNVVAASQPPGEVRFGRVEKLVEVSDRPGEKPSSQEEQVIVLLQNALAGRPEAVTALLELAWRDNDAMHVWNNFFQLRTEDIRRAGAGDVTIQQEIIRLAQKDDILVIHLAIEAVEGTPWAALAVVEAGKSNPLAQGIAELLMLDPQLREVVVRKAEEGNVASQEWMVDAATSDPSLLSLLGLWGAQGKAWARHAFERMEAEDTATDSLSSSSPTALVGVRQRNFDSSSEDRPFQSPDLFAMMVSSMRKSGIRKPTPKPEFGDYGSPEALAEAALKDRNAAELLIHDVQSGKLDSKLWLAERDFSALLPPDVPLDSNQLFFAHRLAEAGSLFAQERLKSDDLAAYDLKKIEAKPEIYSAELADLILMAKAKNPRAREFVFAFNEGAGKSEDWLGFEMAARSRYEVVFALADLGRDQHTVARDTLQDLEAKIYALEAVSDPRALKVLFTLEEFNNFTSREWLVKLYDLMLRSQGTRRLNVYDFIAERKLVEGLNQVERNALSDQALAMVKAALQHYGIRYGLTGLEGRLQRGLDPSGMLAVPNSRDRVERIAKALGAPMDEVTRLTNDLHVGGIWRNGKALAEATDPAILTWMVAAHLTSEGSKTEAEFLQDYARLMRDLNEAAESPRAAAQIARNELVERSREKFQIIDGVPYAESDAFLEMAMNGHSFGVVREKEGLHFVGAEKLDYSILKTLGLVETQREDPIRKTLTTFYVDAEGKDVVKKLNDGFAIVFGDHLELAKNLARTGGSLP